MEENVTVLLVDDHAILREGYKHLLESSGITVVGSVGSSEEGYQLFREFNPSITILDLSMPGQNGLDCLHKIISYKPKAHVLVCSMHEDPALAAKSIQVGAMGYITKSCTSTVLLDAIEHLQQGKHYFLPDMATAIALEKMATEGEKHGIDKLSHQEFSIFKMLADGKNNLEISKELALTTKTVSNYKGNMMKKLNISNIRELLLLAQKKGILVVPPGNH